MDHKTALKKAGNSGALRLCTISRRLAVAGPILLLLLSIHAFAATEESFAVLRVGNHTYQNVRVTTKGKDFIIIAHSGGITSLKLSQLPPQILKKLGYAVPPSRKKHIEGPAMWAATWRRF